MEEPSELLSEENKVSLEKNKKRKLKTPFQVMGLEKFYNEHKYPTEEMKLELADELGLTEKQVSGWFCHRRLKDKRLGKDEACGSGRQDRSSGVIQDRGSGLGQDSCGSTKHGDHRHLDPKEVESRGLNGLDFSAADITYERRSHYTGNDSGIDDTSSESSSSLQGRLFPQVQDSYNMDPSRYLTPNRALPPINPKSAIKTGYKPSGYLKVKGEVEHAAITAVKKQLGMQYREDGPPLSVEFDPLPPGAFEFQNADPVHELYYLENPALTNAPEISASKRQPSTSPKYDSYNSKFSYQDSHIDGTDLGSLHDTELQGKKSHQHIKQSPTFHSYTNRMTGRTSSIDMYEGSIGKASANKSNKNYRVSAMHGVGMRFDSASNDSDHYEGMPSAKQTDSLLHGYDNVNPKNVQKSEHMKFKPSNSTHNHCMSIDTEERGLSARVAKEDKYKGDKKARKQYHVSDRVTMLPNEIMVSKQARVDLPQQYNVKQVPIAEIKLQRNQRSAAEMPSSFSEDETADTSSSLD